MTPPKPYEPRGKTKALVELMQIQPDRVHRMERVAALLGIKPHQSTVQLYLESAIAHRLVYRINHPKAGWLYALKEITDEMLTASGFPPASETGFGIRNLPSPFTPEEQAQLKRDARAPGPSGYVPPAMPNPRGATAAEMPRIRPAPTPTPTPAPTAVPSVKPDIARTLIENTEIKTPAPHLYEKLKEELEEEDPFNASRWIDGEVVLYGVEPNEDGSITLTAERVELLRMLLTEWAAPAT